MKAIRLTINLVFLSISIFLSTYFMIHLTNNTAIRVGLALFTIALEVAMQYVLALGKFKARAPRLKTKCLAIVLFVCYGIYICAYSLPSAVGFFVAELNKQDQIYTQAEQLATANQAKLQQIQTTIATLNTHLQAEAATGYGSRSRAIMAQIDGLSAERDRLLESTQATNDAAGAGNAAAAPDPFRGLSVALGVPANRLAVVVFGISVCMLWLVLIITSWDLPAKFAGDQETKQQRRKALPVTQAVTVRPGASVTPLRAGNAGLCACGCGKPRRGRSKYAEAKCKTALFRKKHKRREEQLA